MVRGLFVLAFFFFVTSAYAQPCHRYALQDRSEILRLFSSTQLDGVNAGVGGVLTRMANVAYLLSIPKPLVNIGLKTQRQAIENEYQALISMLDQLGKQTTPRLRKQSRLFLAEIVNIEYLGLAGTTLSGETDEEAILNSKYAGDQLAVAQKKLWRCF